MEAAAPAFSYARANEPRNTRKTRKGLSGDRSFCINGGITVLRQDLRPADRLAPIKGSNIMAAVTLRKPADFSECHSYYCLLTSPWASLYSLYSCSIFILLIPFPCLTNKKQ